MSIVKKKKKTTTKKTYYNMISCIAQSVSMDPKDSVIMRLTCNSTAKVKILTLLT